MPQLQPGMARIRVKDLRLRTFIGINEDEILNKQDVLINLTILYAAQEAVRDNDIDHALQALLNGMCGTHLIKFEINMIKESAAVSFGCKIFCI